MRWLMVALAAAGCSEQEFNVQNIAPLQGELALSGRVCHPTTKIWLPDALVYTHLYTTDDVVYDSVSDYSDADGWYTLDGLVPEQDYEIYVQLGHDIIDKFIITMGVEDAELPATGCFDDAELTVAVITGAYDALEPVLDAVGVTGVHVVDGQVGSEITDFLTDPAAMAEFDMVFFDGGHREDGVIYGAGPVTQIQENLRAYVDAGGVIYATDWAYDVIETTWPSKVEFFGDDAVPDAAQVGEPGTVAAAVSDSELQTVLGRSNVDVLYDLPVWPLIESVDTDVVVLLEGDAPFRQGMIVDMLPTSPLLVRFDAGAGRVLFSTYRNSANNNEAMIGVLLSLVGGVETR